VTTRKTPDFFPPLTFIFEKFTKSYVAISVFICVSVNFDDWFAFLSSSGV